MNDLLCEEIGGVFDPSGCASERSRLTEVLQRVGCGAPIDAGPLLIGGGQLADTGASLSCTAGRPRMKLGSNVSVASAIAADYERRGADVLHHIAGPFALAAWSHTRSEGVLAQDPLGGRSLFVYDLGGRIVFASEVALLLEVLGTRPGPDPVAMVHWLVDHRVHDGRTLYAGIRRLGGGQCLLLGARSPGGPRPWWTPHYRRPLSGQPEEHSRRLLTAVDLAVGQALEPDKSNAVLLSGGLDSSLVAALAARLAPEREATVCAITAIFPDEPELDEWRWAGEVVDAVGFRADRVAIPERDPLELLSAWLKAWQLPLPTPGYMIERPLLEAARSAGVAVVLDGQGGDELFGVAGFLLGDRLRQGRPVSAWSLARCYPEFGERPSRRQVARLLALQGIPAAMPYRLQEALRRRRAWPVPPWLLPAMAQLHRETADPWGWKRRHGPLWWRSLSYMLTAGREIADIADYLRRRGRLAGVEARSPLLSLSLAELVLQLPPELNFDPRWTRALVREAARGLVPDHVRHRVPKTNFAALYFRALAAPSSRERLWKLFDRQPELAAYVDVAEVRRRIVNRVPQVGQPGWQIWLAEAWNLVSAGAWLEVQAGKTLQILHSASQP